MISLPQEEIQVVNGSQEEENEFPPGMNPHIGSSIQVVTLDTWTCEQNYMGSVGYT